MTDQVSMTQQVPIARHRRWFSVALLLLVSAAGNLAAQNAPATDPAMKAPAPTLPQSPAGQPASAISNGQAVYLVRSTLLTLNDANRSGNYTVLRDLAAPDFQAKNTAADLAQSFSDLRRRNFDLFAVALMAPQFSAPPALDANGRLRLSGYFATRPLRINFDLTFQSVGGLWRLLAISVATPEAPAAQSELNPPPSRNPGKPFYGFRVFSGALGWRF
jgi:hypothetical protein